LVTKVGVTQCTDGIDNDMDGLIDGADPECTGSADNDESSFGTGIPGDNVDACKQDCFFDGNSGMGDDGCQWQLQCDPMITTGACTYDPSYVSKHMDLCSTTMSQSQKCIDNCRKYVPNGCDCFGCCAIPGAPTPIRLSSTCTTASFNDPSKCAPCTMVTQCMNTCGRCELCVGKTSVPEDCTITDTDGGGQPGGDGGTPSDGGHGVATCEGAQSCVPGPNDGCPTGTGCVTGCCIPIVQCARKGFARRGRSPSREAARRRGSAARSAGCRRAGSRRSPGASRDDPEPYSLPARTHRGTPSFE
jgi:hypothetical protein